MATTIETLIKPNGDQVLPRTRAKAVSMESGLNLESVINNIFATISGLPNEDYIKNQIAELVNSAPEKLNTLNELAAALGNDENFASTITEQLSNKPNTDELGELAFKDSITASDIGALPDTTVIPSIDGLASEDYVNEQVANKSQVQIITWGAED